MQPIWYTILAAVPSLFVIKIRLTYFFIQNVVEIFNNLLDENNREGWSVLQDVS